MRAPRGKEFESRLLEDFEQVLRLRRLKVETQKPLPIFYKDVMQDCGYRLDLIVEDQVIIEIKSVNAIAPIHEAQLLSYLRLYGTCTRGLLINFNRPLSKPQGD